MKLGHSASHWGAFATKVENGRLIDVIPFRADKHPTKLITAWPEMLTSPLRVAKPSIRKGWLEGDRGKGRGEDKYVEVEWSEALDLTAGHLKSVIAESGNSAIFGGSYGWSSAGRLHHARTLLHRFLNSIGGFTGQVTNYSYGAAMAFLPSILGGHEALSMPVSDWRALVENCEVLITLGGIPRKNWEVLSGGFGLHEFDDRMATLKQSGMEVFNVSPYRGDLEGDEFTWLPIRPNTDTAFLLALVTELIKAGKHDRAFLDRYTSGFDKVHNYLMGMEDGVVRDSHWASPITGLPASTILKVAQTITDRKVMVTATWSLQRARHGEQPYWAAITLAAALGQIGLPGTGFAFGYGSMNGAGNPKYDTPLTGPGIGKNDVGIFIPVARVSDLLLNPGKTINYNGRDVTYPEIRMIYWCGGNPFHHHQDLKQLRSAFRTVDVVVVHEQFWTTTARHADIVLPATTSLERNDIGGSSRDPYLLAMQKATNPYGEARNDFDIFGDLAERLGARSVFTENRTEEEWLRHMWDYARSKLDTRSIEAPTFDEFWEKGYFEMPTPESRFVYLSEFRADPEGRPLPTPSGKVELFSDLVAKQNIPGQPGHVVWADPEEWLGAPKAERFPLHLLTPQPSARLHSQMEASSHSRAAKRQDREIVRLSPIDAAHRGITSGDIVRLFNDRGSCLASAELDDGVMQGVALLPTGASWDPDEFGNDRSSNPNVLTRDIGTSELGQGCAAQSCLVDIEMFRGPLPALRIFSPPDFIGNN